MPAANLIISYEYSGATKNHRFTNLDDQLRQSVIDGRFIRFRTPGDLSEYGISVGNSSFLNRRYLRNVFCNGPGFLHLTDVEHYRKRIDFVPGGHTAILFVDGEGVATLAAFLDAKADREYFWLIAGAE